MKRDNIGYILRRKSDGSYMLYDEVRYSRAGANQALWNWVSNNIPYRLHKHGYSTSEAWSICHAAKRIRRDKYTLDAINDELQRVYTKHPVTDEQINAYFALREEMHDEWAIEQIKVVY